MEDLFAVSLVERHGIFVGRPLWGDRVECCCIWTVPAPSVLECYSNTVFDGSSGAGAVCHFLSSGSLR